MPLLDSTSFVSPGSFAVGPVVPREEVALISASGVTLLHSQQVSPASIEVALKSLRGFRTAGRRVAWLNLADTLARAERHAEAIATFQHAISLRPDDPHGHNDLGNLFVIVGRPADALPHFERAVALKPDMADALSNFGNALRALGRSSEAMGRSLVAGW